MRKRLYYESLKTPLHLGTGERISVPTAVAKFGKEAPFPPRSWVERGYNLRRWTTFPGGNPFAVGSAGAELGVGWMEKGQR